MIYEQRWWTVTNEANSRYSPSPILDLPSDAVRYQLGIRANDSAPTYWSEMKDVHLT
jgi:hypothetical protein